MTIKEIPVSEARELGKKYGAKRVIILYSDSEMAGYASWGLTKQLCTSTWNIAEQVLKQFQELIVKSIRNF